MQPLPGRLKFVALFVMLFAVGCAGLSPSAEPLAKFSGWRADLTQPPVSTQPVLEIAYDRETAELAWQENVAGEPDTGGSQPDEHGLFADLNDVDFARQVLVIWSSSESSSCPSWLENVRTNGLTVEVETAQPDPEVLCSADRAPYRMALAVSRRAVPASDEVERATMDFGTVSSYPATSP